ncbi:MAG: hypothetical protein HUJ42_02800 [Malacoplasma sp.]|nr:hypothetical protein [Malacoplasma sp.]
MAKNKVKSFKSKKIIIVIPVAAFLISGGITIGVTYKNYYYYQNIDNMYQYESNQTKYNLILSQLTSLKAELNISTESNATSNSVNPLSLSAFPFYTSNISLSQVISNYVVWLKSINSLNNNSFNTLFEMSYISFFSALFLNSYTNSSSLSVNKISAYTDLHSYSYSLYLLICTNKNAIEPSNAGLIAGIVLISIAVLLILVMLFYILAKHIRAKKTK